MAFPFTITFKRKLRGVITPNNQLIALQYIKTKIEEDAADNIVMEENGVSYKGTTSRWRGALFNGPDSGQFSLIATDDQWHLIYEIRMHQSFMITGGMSLLMGIVSQVWWFVLVAFSWLCGMNWFIINLRHGGLAADIADGVNDLLFGKEKNIEEDNPDKEKLKSWF